MYSHAWNNNLYVEEIYNMCRSTTTGRVANVGANIQIPVSISIRTRAPGDQAMLLSKWYYISQRFLFLRMSNILSPSLVSALPAFPVRKRTIWSLQEKVQVDQIVPDNMSRKPPPPPPLTEPPCAELPMAL